MKNKEHYVVPSLEILAIQETDVIRTSPSIDVGANEDWETNGWIAG